MPDTPEKPEDEPMPPAQMDADTARMALAFLDRATLQTTEIPAMLKVQMALRGFALRG